MQVGIAGIGRMGAAIAARLMEVGHSLSIWNRSPAKLKPLADAGAAVSNSPAELASAVDVIITILTDAAAIEAVYFGPQGLLSADVNNKLFIEMSTLQPQVAPTLVERVRAKGATFIECPVSGTTGPARQGKLLGLVGGEPADVARARHILDQICRRVQHAGPVGSGAVLKLAVNLPLMVYWQALGESLAMCKTLNIRPEELLDFLTETSGAANALRVRSPLIVAKLKGLDPGPVTFNIDGGIKDIEAMLAEGERRGIELPLVQRTLECYREVSANTSGDDEISSVAAYWPNRSKR